MASRLPLAESASDGDATSSSSDGEFGRGRGGASWKVALAASVGAIVVVAAPVLALNVGGAGDAAARAGRGARAQLQAARAELQSTAGALVSPGGGGGDGDVEAADAGLQSAAAGLLATSDGGDVEAEVGVASSAAESIQHWAQDCWHACGGAGLCEWCGHGNACCRHGSDSDPLICLGAKFWPAYTYHTCVRAETPRQIPLQPTPPPPVEDMSLDHAPIRALGYAGIAWKDMSFAGSHKMHILAIGDWGGMDGLVITDVRPNKEYRRIIQYSGGDGPGPHVMARSRPGCKFDNLVECFNTRGETGYDPRTSCLPACGWTDGIDDRAQLLVAEQFKKRAAEVDPQYILNVGDNFYWGGIETDCGTPMAEISPVARQQFDHIFESIYSGPGLDGKPWLSVLGNHDWGGRYFNAGWDQQIAYTWASDRWVMPAPYYSVHVEYPDQSFGADIFMIDSNVFDAKDLDKDSEHNICGAAHTPESASCTAAGGPPSLAECKAWFEDFWQKQKTWLEGKLGESSADWQIVVTHFPCGHDAGWYSHLHRDLGLDLLVTGHRHEQELWPQSRRLGGLTCIVTGGGGGITSEWSPQMRDSQYGFFDLAISKEELFVELVNHEGRTLKTSTVYPKSPSQ